QERPVRSLVVLALALGCAGGALAEARVTGADLAEIRAVIHREIDAFRACARSAPGAAVTSPATVSFLDLTVMGGEDVVQQVRVTDHAGAVWLAYYAMQ